MVNEARLATLRELLADQEHDRWSRWQRHLHRGCTRSADGSLVIPPQYVANLERQLNTSYSGLSEHEKDSDRSEADNTIRLLMRLGFLPPQPGIFPDE